MSLSTNILELADGRIIDPTSGREINPFMEDLIDENYVSVPSNTEAQAIVTQTRRKISDLPDIPERMNTISIVLTYYMFGMDDDEIAIASGLRIEQIVSIKLLDAFSKMQEAVSKGILRDDKSAVQSIIEDAGVDAANTVSLIMKTSDSEDLKLKAAKDILDRGGHRPADVLEVRGMMANVMRIEHVIRSDDMKAPVIEVNPIDIEVTENGNGS